MEDCWRTAAYGVQDAAKVCWPGCKMFTRPAKGCGTVRLLRRRFRTDNRSVWKLGDRWRFRKVWGQRPSHAQDHSDAHDRSSGDIARQKSGSDKNLQRPVPEGTYAWRDVLYYQGPGADEAKHRLDVYVAASPYPRPLQPVILFVHGGSWVRGDRQHPALPGLYDNVGAACARLGCVGLVMSYRLSPKVQHPEHVRDVARALRWVQQGHVRPYGGDPTRVFLAGHSAGAHLCTTLLCMPWLMRRERLYGEHEGADSVAPDSPPIGLRGIIGVSGVYNLQRLHDKSSSFSWISKWSLPPIFGREASLWSSASPVHLLGRRRDGHDAGHTHEASPLPLDNLPLLLLTAERDFHLDEDATELLRVLDYRKKGPKRLYEMVPDTNHLTVISSLGSKSQVDKDMSRLVSDFVKEHDGTH